jgi:signal transduction histidine kinase
MTSLLPRGVRARLLLVVLVALAAALVAATVGFNVLLTALAKRDADSLLRQQAASARALIRVEDGHLRVNDTLADSRIWVFRGEKPIEGASTPGDTTATARALAAGPSRFVNVEGGDDRLFSLPIRDNGRRVGTVVVGLSLAPYERTRRIALIASFFFAAALLGAVGFAVWWLLRSALRPVAQMTTQAAAWSDNDLDRRFALGEPHDELTRLAATLDQLLGRIEASLRHERRLSAELSHELRTPLAKLIAETELALRRPRTEAEYRDALVVVMANAQQIARIVQTLLAAAEQEAGARGVCDAGAAARAAADACAPVAAARGVEVSVDERDPALRVGVDLDLAERILHPVVDNACRYGEARVVLSIARANGAVVFTVADDGPGIADSEREAIFEPAARGDAGRRAGNGAGLGLALARRLAHSVAGEVDAAAAESGARFVVRLPAA